MFISNLECRPAGRFRGPIVVTMRPVPKAQVQLASDLSARYPYAHGGSPVHIGRPEDIGISDLSRPDYGEPVAIYEDEVTMFLGLWGHATGSSTRCTTGFHDHP
jgi:uncharacterized protein YcsI (UPF0317 family)